MKTFRQIREGSERPKIIVPKKHVVCRDGGSHMREVLNPEECGFVQLIQDFGIHSEKKGTRGKWFGMLPPPNHLCSQHVEVDESQIEFT